MTRVPIHWLIVDFIYHMLGRFGYMIGDIKLVDIEIAHIDRRLKQARDAI